MIENIKKKYSIFSHCQKNKMSYLQHFNISFNFSIKLGIASIQALIHSLLPSLYITSTTDVVADIENQLAQLKKKN